MFPAMEELIPNEQGLIGTGGDLSPKTLLEAYPKGIFPWEGKPPIPWFSPDPRPVLIPRKVRISRSLAKQMKHVQFKINEQFRNVMIRCATVHREGQKGTWISRATIGAYVELHYRGWAHSIEVYSEDKLVGGLYGLAIGRAFFGESMFHLQPSASKLALVHLCQRLEQDEFHFVDCQQDTPHMRSMGAEPLSRSDYLKRLKEATRSAVKWTP